MLKQAWLLSWSSTTCSIHPGLLPCTRYHFIAGLIREIMSGSGASSKTKISAWWIWPSDWNKGFKYKRYTATLAVFYKVFWNKIKQDRSKDLVVTEIDWDIMQSVLSCCLWFVTMAVSVLFFLLPNLALCHLSSALKTGSGNCFYLSVNFWKIVFLFSRLHFWEFCLTHQQQRCWQFSYFWKFIFERRFWVHFL